MQILVYVPWNGYPVKYGDILSVETAIYNFAKILMILNMKWNSSSSHVTIFDETH